MPGLFHRKKKQSEDFESTESMNTAESFSADNITEYNISAGNISAENISAEKQSTAKQSTPKPSTAKSSTAKTYTNQSRVNDERYPKTVEQLAMEKRHERINAPVEVKEEKKEQRKKRREWKRKSSKAMRIFIWTMAFILTIIFAFLCSRFFCTTVRLNESSMDPTLSPGQTLLVNTITYRSGSVKRGDVIAFQLGDDEEATIRIKRVIGLPGEKIQIKNGKVYIDGELYDSGDLPDIIDAGLAEEEIRLESGEYFVLGDNRNGSEDSRYASVGNITTRNIVGKVWFCVSPITRIGFVS